MATKTPGVTLVELSQLRPNPWQPRLTLDQEALKPLVQSIRRYGFIGHIEAREENGKLQIVFGHRRARAAAEAGLKTVPVQITARNDDEMKAIAFLENHTQQKLTYWEEALFFDQLMREMNLSYRGLAELLGISKGYIQNRLELLRLPEEDPLRELASQNQIDMTTVTAFLALRNALPPAEAEEVVRGVTSGQLKAKDLKALKQAMREPEVGDRGERTHVVPVTAEEWEAREVALGASNPPGPDPMRIGEQIRFAVDRLPEVPDAEARFDSAVRAVLEQTRPVRPKYNEEVRTERGPIVLERVEIVPPSPRQRTRRVVEMLAAFAENLAHEATKVDWSTLTPEERASCSRSLERIGQVLAQVA